MRAQEFIFETTIKSDIPNLDWLKNKRAYAIEKGRDRWGAPYFGTATGRVKGNVIVPVETLKHLKGMRREQENVRKNDLAAIMKIMKDTGRLPLTKSGEEYVPFITVAYNGEAWVNEGNHRIMAADRLGWDSLPIELTYFDGGEWIEDGPLYPPKLGLTLPKKWWHQ